MNGPFVTTAATSQSKRRASGSGGSVSIPDSSTSENLHVQIPVSKESNKIINLDRTAKVTQTKTQYLLKVANVKNNVALKPNEVVSISTLNTLPRLKPKPDESKIKILSDIKVDKTFSNSEGLNSNLSMMPAVLQNATSSPLLQMQTILINGTPIYKHTPFGQKNFTEDEIMAMPTIILTPASGSSQISVSQSTETSRSCTTQSVASGSISTAGSSRSLAPLVIDVISSNKNHDNINDTSNQSIKSQKLSPVEANNDQIEQAEVAVVKPADITSASAPKDTTSTGTVTSTPQVFPPLRKSSSTPRRTSHVRVLDFTTPRRILHETANKCVPNVAVDNDTEIVLSKSPNISINVEVENVVEEKHNESSNKGNKGLSKKSNKNWDTDLRVLATVSERNLSPCPKAKPKPKSTKKTKVTKNKPANPDRIDKDKKSNKKKTPKTKTPKFKPKDDDIIIPDVKVDVPLKPSINIISGPDRNSNTSSEINKSLNTSKNEDHVDTPEMERISLQNEIGVKLNISDLLETPYKQALYDIQMETPRFLGPDIPDDPMSDIKIMNIPTPRFLNTAATPSSYSSRPTDYSSGGSYYKPEDQDYMRVHDELDCPVTSSKDSIANDALSNKDSDDSKEKENMKPSRPVRKCTKNVSYSLATMSTRSRNADSRGDTDSSVDSIAEKPVAEKTVPVTPKIKEPKSKPDVSKKVPSRKRKSPVKKEMVKSFMKIKPRRPTPLKNIAKGKRKSIDQLAQAQVLTRKKTAIKEGREVIATPVINSAPSKSRRKSSTPRKLHCSKSFHTESSGHDSPELVSKNNVNISRTNLINVLESDPEQLLLRWSDDGSQEPQPVVLSIPNESDDIKKIQEYIETTLDTKQRGNTEEVSLHIDLVKRGFDLETAKSIERDLLDTPPYSRQDNAEQEKQAIVSNHIDVENTVTTESKVDEQVLEKTLESDCSTTNKLQIVQNDDEEVDEEIELSVHECNEDSTNYITCDHNTIKDIPKTEPTKLRDKFSMEVCIDDGVSIRLRATPFSLLLDQDPQIVEYLNYSYRETEMAVSSISNYDKLYTPVKDSFKDQCYDIFDSTLTSLDTPLKVRSPKKAETEVSVAEIVLEVEKVEEKVETKKRKRVQSGNLSDESATESKKTKSEAQLLFNSSNIQNFDIDSVLSKLHGP